jgi:peptidyl-tRNA hydrolase
VQQIGTPDFHRISMGIGRPVHDTAVSDHVLSDFSVPEMEALLPLFPRSLDLIKQIIDEQSEQS